MKRYISKIVLHNRIVHFEQKKTDVSRTFRLKHHNFGLQKMWAKNHILYIYNTEFVFV